MGLTARKTIDLGLIRLNFTLDGLSRWTFRALPRLSWNSRTRGRTVDLPGSFKWTSAHRSRKALR